MRVMADTNIIISAILKMGSVPDLVLDDICENHELVLCDYIIAESYEVAKKRFPTRLQVLDQLFMKLRYELVLAPEYGGMQMRDVKDQPILNAAIGHKIDLLVTGDKHFLELTIETPSICTPSEYMNKYAIKL